MYNIYLSLYLHICLSLYLPMSLYTYLLISLSTYLSIYPSIYLTSYVSTTYMYFGYYLEKFAFLLGMSWVFSAFLIAHRPTTDLDYYLSMYIRRPSRKAWLLTQLWLFFFTFLFPSKKRGKKKRRMNSKIRDQKSCLYSWSYQKPVFGSRSWEPGLFRGSRS